MIRLGALRAFGRGVQQWCRRLALPVVLTAWSLSSPSSTWHLLAPPTAFALMIVQYLQEGAVESRCRHPKSIPKAAEQNPRCVTGTKGSTLATYLLDMPTEVLATICGFLHPRDATVLSCLCRASYQLWGQDQIWKDLWYRDYGRTLLQWKVGREAMAESLSTSDAQLEESLSQHLNHLEGVSLKDFYFIFGEIYIDYLLARRNNPAANNCYLGLHGHVFDFSAFAEYHPGLALPHVLSACGQDATAHFEDTPHSRVARAIAGHLVVLVHRGILEPKGHQFGVWLPVRTPPSDLRRVLRLSNSRPVALRESIHPREAAWLERLLPKGQNHPRRRPPTLARIRSQWDAESDGRRRRPPRWQWSRGKRRWSVYYDPLRQTWIRWDAAGTLTTVHG